MIFITLLEKKRKDFIEMMTHHVITSFLVVSSYLMNFTRAGTAILVEQVSKWFSFVSIDLVFLQDFADIFLPLAKMLKYARFSTV